MDLQKLSHSVRPKNRYGRCPVAALDLWRLSTNNTLRFSLIRCRRPRWVVVAPCFIKLRNYGAASACRYFDGSTARIVTWEQAARLDAILPALLKRRREHMGKYSAIILESVSVLGVIGRANGHIPSTTRWRQPSVDVKANHTTE